jgi:hypothetical protein
MKKVGLMVVSDASAILWMMKPALVWELVTALGFPGYEVNRRVYLNHADIIWIAERLRTHRNPNSSQWENWSNEAARTWLQSLKEGA